MCIQFPRQKGRSVLLGFLALALLSGAGCGKAKRATVSGQVTFNGRPLTAGTISFIDKKKRTGTGVIDAKGNYTVSDAPVGEVTIIIDVPKRPLMMGGQMTMKPPPGMGQMKPPEGMEPTGGGATITDPSKIVPIPDKYAKEDSSPLKFSVADGEQTYDIKLTP